MPYDAITIDTNIVKQSGYDFETGILAQLSQFKDGPIQFLISDVVFAEIRRQLTANTKKAREQSIAALKRAIKLGLVADADSEALSASAEKMSDASDAVTERLKAFLIATGAKPVSSDDIAASDVMKRYFKALPPFDEDGPKKSEFPDAVALLGLEKWAASQGKKIIAVSADKGWASFADDSEHIDVLSDLVEALTMLQDHTDEAISQVAVFLQTLADGKHQEKAEELESLIASSATDLQLIGEGESAYTFDLDYHELSLTGFEPRGDPGNYEIEIVRLGTDEIVAQVGMRLELHAEAEFGLSVKDGIDKDYVTIGSSLREADLDQDVQVLLTLVGDLSGHPSELDVLDASLVERSITVNFGSIDIDYGDEADYNDWPDDDFDIDMQRDSVAEELAAASEVLPDEH